MGLVEEWLDVRERSAELGKQFREMQEKVVAELGGDGASVMYRGQSYTLTPVAAKSTVWDREGVLGALTVAQRKRLTVVHLDVEAFTAALKSKELDYKTFGKFKTTTEGKPYVRVTVKA